MEGILRLLRWKHAKEAAFLLAALALYVLGVKFFLIPAVLWLNMRYMPMPRLFGSWVARGVVSLLLVMVLLQIAAAVQFVLLPLSNFSVLAVLLVLLQGVVWWFVPIVKPEQRAWFARSDAAALIVAGFFLLPFAPTLAGVQSVFNISKIAGIQAIDATNHYVGVTEMMRAQHLDYTYGHYYPKGFHIATAFMQSTIMKDQYSLGWRGNVVLFFAQYVVWGVVLAYVALYFGLALLHLLRRRVEAKAEMLLAFCLGPVLALFYLLPFVPHGFLNYYYVVATIVLGFTYLVAWRADRSESAQEWKSFVQDDYSRWTLVAYFLCVFGAAVSWPLLIPPLIVAGLWFILPNQGRVREFVRLVWSPRSLPLVAVLALHIVPIYFQLRYTADSSQGINAIGGLRIFHSLVLVAGVGVLAGVLWSRHMQSAHKRLLTNLYIPLIGFIVMLLTFQYFTTGEIRYYGIKTAMLLEILLLILAVVLLVYECLQRDLKSWKYMIIVPMVPVLAMILLVTTVSNPLKDLRDLFRDVSRQEKPAFFDHDMSEYARLGSSGDIQHYNSTILHYNAAEQKFYAHMQASFWANMMRYDGDREDFEALLCNSTLYSNLAFGTYTSPEQAALIAKVKECAGMAKRMGLPYYIITDKDSAPAIEHEFGTVAKLVY